MNAPLLEVERLTVEFVTRRGRPRALREVSLALYQGETLGLVGESGSGKSVMAQTIIGLLELPGRIVEGSVKFGGETIVDRRGAAGARRIRGSEMGFIFQDPMTSLNPLMTIGDQIGEMLTVHKGYSAEAARQEAKRLLESVGITNAETRLDQFPYEFSGGMRQRAMIAIAIACAPRFLIADEPTTALDVTVQAQILDLMRQLQQERQLTLLMITHDLGVVAAIAHRVAVIYAGRIVEVAPVGPFYERPAHPYAVSLLDSSLRLDDSAERLRAIPGSPPNLLALGSGCAFAPRCKIATARCLEADPPLVEGEDGRSVACWRPYEMQRVTA